MSDEHVVMFSGGVGSWMAARRVAERHGTADLTLLFADTLIEDANSNGSLDVGEDINGNNRLDVELIKISRFGCAATVNETTDGANDTIDNSTQITYTLKGSALERGTFKVCDNRVAGTYNGRLVSLSATGRPATESDPSACL